MFSSAHAAARPRPFAFGLAAGFAAVAAEPTAAARLRPAGVAVQA